MDDVNSAMVGGEKSFGEVKYKGCVLLFVESAQSKAELVPATPMMQFSPIVKRVNCNGVKWSVHVLRCAGCMCYATMCS